MQQNRVRKLAVLSIQPLREIPHTRIKENGHTLLTFGKRFAVEN